jgi:hypothetical protein
MFAHLRPPFEICFEKYFLKMRPRKKCSLRAELSELKIWRAKRAKFFEIIAKSNQKKIPHYHKGSEGKICNNY